MATEMSNEQLTEQYLILADLTSLRKLLEKHDWYYEYSDDHRYWSRGRDEAHQISVLRLSLAARGVDTLDLYTKYCPRMK